MSNAEKSVKSVLKKLHKDGYEEGFKDGTAYGYDLGVRAAQDLLAIMSRVPPTERSVDTDVRAQLLDELDLPMQVLNKIKREGIYTVGELLQRTEDDLLDIRNFGPQSIYAVRARLHERGLQLPGEPALLV